MEGEADRSGGWGWNCSSPGSNTDLCVTAGEAFPRGPGSLLRGGGRHSRSEASGAPVTTDHKLGG